MEPLAEPVVHHVYLIKTTVAFADGEWVRFEGSQERMHLGMHDFKVGDKVRITISHGQ